MRFGMQRCGRRNRNIRIDGIDRQDFSIYGHYRSEFKSNNNSILIPDENGNFAAERHIKGIDVQHQRKSFLGTCTQDARRTDTDLHRGIDAAKTVFVKDHIIDRRTGVNGLLIDF